MLSERPWRIVYGPWSHHVIANWRLLANVEVRAFDLDGRLLDEWRAHNLIMDAGRNLFRQAIQGTNTQVLYCSLGSSNTAVNVSHTQLGSEQFRKQTTKFVLGSTGSITTITYIAPSEANSFTIAELGWHAGDQADANPNTGVLWSRILYSRTKVASESLQIQRTDTLA